MKTGKMRFAARLAAALLIVLTCVLACAGCGTSTPDATGTKAAQTTTPTATAPSVDLGGADPVRTVAGATVALSPQGLRFSGVAEKVYLDALTAAYGEKNVKVGFLVAPTASLINGKIAPAGADTVKLDAGSVITVGPSCHFSSTFPVLSEDNYAKSYSAVAYIEVYGKILATSVYAAGQHDASLSGAADAAYLDVSNTLSDKYQYAITLDGKTRYSPYSEEERETLLSFRFPFAFTVMSYNVEAYDHKDEGGWEGRDYAKALVTVREQSPDIVGFQEVNAEWETMMADLASQNGYTRLPGGYSADKFEKDEIFFKTAKFTLVSEGTKIFLTTATELNVPNTEKVSLLTDNHGRVFHYAVLEQKDSGKRFLVINTHLHYGGTGSGHEEDDKMRRYQLRILFAWIESQGEELPSDLIVMGDMNAHYKEGSPNNGGTRTMQLFFDAGFERTAVSAAVKGDVGGTLNFYNRSARTNDKGETWAFDHILTRGNIGTAYYTVVDNPIGAGNTYPSDHIPVMATVSCR